MATITLKNIPDPTYQALKQQAQEHRRSINGEVIYLIDQAIRSTLINPDQHLLTARLLRKKTETQPVNDTALTEMKSEGRP